MLNDRCPYVYGPHCGLGYGMAFSRLPYLISRNRFQGKLKSLYIVNFGSNSALCPELRLRWVPGVIRLIIEQEWSGTFSIFQRGLLCMHIRTYNIYIFIYINDFIHADWATVCRAKCLGFPVASFWFQRRVN